MKRKLVLFDIDGTIQRDNGAAREAFSTALDKVFEFRTDLTRFDFSGMTDPLIVRMILSESNFTDDVIQDRTPDLWDCYLDNLTTLITTDSVRIMPGILEILGRFDDDPDVRLGLLTGNIERGARIKLSAFDLNRFFPFGAFGSDSPKREELPPVAAARATSIDGYIYSWNDTFIIGDSIHDVGCCRPHGAVSIAVATGVTPAQRLIDEEPNFFFETLEDTDAVVSVIAGDS